MPIRELLAPRAVLITAVIGGALAAILVIAAAGIGWLVGSRTLAGALAMVVAGMLIIGFGGMHLPWWASVFVGLSWAFADTLLARLGATKVLGWFTMAAVYLIIGATKGESRSQVVASGCAPAIGLLVAVGLGTAFSPRHVAEGIDQEVISASMISAVRSAREFTEVLRRRNKST